MNLEITVTNKKQNNRGLTQGTDRKFTATVTTTAGNQSNTDGRLKEFSIQDENFGHDSTSRLLTANQSVGLPRRDPLKSKVATKMQGVMGGETAAQNLIDLEGIVNSFIQGRLPKIGDPRYSK